jgi:hypothetical protein
LKRERFSGALRHWSFFGFLPGRIFMHSPKNEKERGVVNMTDTTPEQLEAMHDKALAEVGEALQAFYEAQGSDLAEAIQRVIATMTFLGL